MTAPSGQAPVRVSRFRARDNEKAMPISDTSGPLFMTSSPSIALQSSLESKLRERMGANGSPEYALTWKHWDMPAGLPICALRASARRTTDRAFGGLPTPQTQYDGRTNQAWRVAKLKMKARHASGLYGKGTGAPGMMDLQRAMRLRLNSEGGLLSPKWVASLMGYPRIWTDIAPSGTRSSHKSPPNSSLPTGSVGHDVTA
jgi:hypothetical protein